MDVLYRWLYHVTFVPHVLCVAWVAGGTLWLVVLGARARRESDDPVADALRDWLPFVLGLGITFGVGPLLFVQRLQGTAFYSANLLLSHRFMVLLPALIVGFYLLYVQKTDWNVMKRRSGRVGVPAAAFACFAYTGWSWSRNHLLAQAPGTWAQAYVDSAAFPGFLAVAPRLLVFLGLALQAAPVLVLLATWKHEDAGRLRRRLARVAVLGVLVTTGAVFLHGAVPGMADPTAPLVSLLVIEALVALAWIAGRRAALAGVVAAFGTLLAVERVAWLREMVWIARNPEFEVGEPSQGLPLFLVTLLGVTIAIVLVALRVRRDLKSA